MDGLQLVESAREARLRQQVEADRAYIATVEAAAAKRRKAYDRADSLYLRSLTEPKPTEGGAA